jgi:hypothetical protein
MAKAIAQRNRLSYLRGWDAALETVWAALAEVPRDELTPDQQALRDGIFDYVSRLSPDEESLKVKPTNAELAEKYAVSPRTVTNWRGQACPFEDGQRAVLDWVSEQRIIPAGVKAKFARQLERRLGNQELDDLAALRAQGKQLLNEVRQLAV